MMLMRGMMVALAFGVALQGFASVRTRPVESDEEAALEKRLPEIIEKSATHYTSLLQKADANRARTTDCGRIFPHNWQSGKTLYVDPRTWTSGFFPGSLWLLYELTENGVWKDLARRWTEPLATNSVETSNHDVGFIMCCSYGNARRLEQTNRYDDLLARSADSLCKRFNRRLGLIRSWGALDEKKDFLVIPDNLMNLELLCLVSSVCRMPTPRAREFRKVAVSHADVTMRNHFRPDGGCYHVLDYDQPTGRVKGILRGQGASCETAWSRGQSWSIYGYVMMYRQTGLRRYLDFAMKLADYAMNHPNMPADGIPYWDFGAPGEERDTSAGAIMASALFELSRYVGETDRARYRGFAVKQVASLASPAYFAAAGENGDFLLMHGVGSKPEGFEVDTPLVYGDYYFLEALIRFRELRADSATGRMGRLIGSNRLCALEMMRV